MIKAYKVMKAKVEELLPGWEIQPVAAPLADEGPTRGVGIAANRAGNAGAVDSLFGGFGGEQKSMKTPGVVLNIQVVLAAADVRVEFPALVDAAVTGPYEALEAAAAKLADLEETRISGEEKSTDGYLDIQAVSETMAHDEGLYINTLTIAATWTPAAASE